MTDVTAFSASDLFEDITAGKYDKWLSGLLEAASERKRYLQTMKGVENQQKLKAGTPVRIGPGIKPKYLVGLTGTISDKPAGRKGDLMFEFDDRSYPYVSYRFQRIVGVPASLLTEIPAMR